MCGYRKCGSFDLFQHLFLYQFILFPAICGMRSDPGPCRESVQKWYYDYEQGLCQKFVYGGCRGNENNFDSKAACLQACNVKGRAAGILFIINRPC